MAKRKEAEETISEPEPFPPTPCAFCGGDGQKLKGWDEDGNDLLEPCSECNGTGTVV